MFFYRFDGKLSSITLNSTQSGTLTRYVAHDGKAVNGQRRRR
jgi:hypothetical protein